MQDELYIRIPLGGRRCPVRGYALIDMADAEQAEFQWSPGKNGYARRSVKRNGKWTHLLLHRAILGLEYSDSREGDHINGDKLDNRRCNLRIVTRAQNAQNVPGLGGQSRHRGVVRRWGKWCAQAQLRGRVYYLGLYENEEAAAAAAAAFRILFMSHTVEERSTSGG